MKKLIKVRRLTYDPDFNIGQIYEAYQRTPNSFDLIEDPIPTVFKDGVGEYDFRDNWEKLPYNTKILSDGTVARVGTIAHDINRRFTGTILKTISDDIGFNRVGPSSNDIILSTPNTERGWGWNASYSPTKFALYVYVSELRKATPEERKQYYKDLQNL